MTTKQVEQLSALQRSIFTEVANNNQSKIVEIMGVMWYWVRKQIWRKVGDVMIECETDLELAAKFETHHIQLSNELHNDFCVLQGELIRAEAAQADDRVEKWGHYIKWVEAVIDQEVLQRTAKYVKLTATSQNGKLQKR